MTVCFFSMPTAFLTAFILGGVCCCPPVRCDAMLLRVGRVMRWLARFGSRSTGSSGAMLPESARLCAFGSNPF